MNIANYYEVLCVPLNATQAEIRKAYHRLAKLHHPDLSNSPNSVRFMQSLNEAYDVLGNPEKRARYDSWRRYSQQSFHNENQSRSVIHTSPYPQNRPENGTSSSSYPKNRPQPGAPVRYSFREWLEDSLYFIDCIIHPFMVIILGIVIYSMPFLLYHLILGKLFAWIAPLISITSNDASGFSSICSAVLSWYTTRQLRKMPAIKKLMS